MSNWCLTPTDTTIVISLIVLFFNTFICLFIFHSSSNVRWVLKVLTISLTLFDIIIMQKEKVTKSWKKEIQHFHSQNCLTIIPIFILLKNKIELISDQSTHRNNTLFKACVRYFLWNFYFLPNDSPLKTTKNVFYFV